MRRAFAVLMLLLCVVRPALAAEQIRIGIGYGLAFLPIYICQDLKLIEKYAGARHIDLRPAYERFLGAGPVQDAIATGAIDIGPFGAAPLLMAWERGRNTPRQILAVSGMTTLPLTLLSNQARVRTVADLRPSDRIAIPMLTAPQMYFLQMQSEKIFGDDRLGEQAVAMSNAAALAALFAGESAVDAYFASPPFVHIALKDARVHRVLNSEQVIGGKASFLILGATRGYIDAHPKIPQIIDQAMDEAARIIRDQPARAARIYLAHEPFKALDAGDIEAVLKADKDEFGSTVAGLQAFAAFMARHGALKRPPKSWKDLVAPALLNSPGS